MHVCLPEYRKTYIRKSMHTCIRTYGLMDRQTDAPVPACSLTNCYANWRKYKSTENKKILLLYDSQERCVVFFYLNRQCRPRCRLKQGILLTFFIILKTFHKKNILANRNPINIHRPRVKPRTCIHSPVYPSIQTNSSTYIHRYINSSIRTTVVLTYIRISTNPNINGLYRLIRTYVHID